MERQQLTASMMTPISMVAASMVAASMVAASMVITVIMLMWVSMVILAMGLRSWSLLVMEFAMIAILDGTGVFQNQFRFALNTSTIKRSIANKLII
eukprot:gene15532-11112_t